jgi:hypothetical protein
VNATVFEVDGPKTAGLRGMNIAVIECGPTGSCLMLKAEPAVTGAGPPRLVVPSLNWMVPAALVGATFALRITRPPPLRGRGIGIAVSVVVVAVTPGPGVGLGVVVGVGVGVSVGVGVGVEVGVGVSVGVGVGVPQFRTSWRLVAGGGISYTALVAVLDPSVARHPCLVAWSW